MSSESHLSIPLTPAPSTVLGKQRCLINTCKLLEEFKRCSQSSLDSDITGKQLKSFTCLGLLARMAVTWPQSTRHAEDTFPTSHCLPGPRLAKGSESLHVCDDGPFNQESPNYRARFLQESTSADHSYKGFPRSRLSLRMTVRNFSRARDRAVTRARGPPPAPQLLCSKKASVLTPLEPGLGKIASPEFLSGEEGGCTSVILRVCTELGLGVDVKW